MAAGLSLQEENVEAFRRKLNENCVLTQEDMIEKIVIDVPMPMSYVTIPLIRQLSQLEPLEKAIQSRCSHRRSCVLQIAEYSGKTEMW